MQKRDHIAQTVGAGDRRLSLKLKAELSLGQDSVPTRLLSILSPQGPPSLSAFPSIYSLPFPLVFLSPTLLSVFFHINFPMFSFMTEPWQVITYLNFFLKFLKVRNKIFKCSQIVRGYISFHSLSVAKEGKKIEHFHFILKQVSTLIFTHMYKQIIMVRSYMNFSRGI